MTTYTKFIHLVEGSWLLENAADVLSSRGQIYRLRSTCQKKIEMARLLRGESKRL